MHHGPAQKAALHLAARPNARPHGQRFLLRGVEAEKAQRAGVGAVVHRHQQLAARAEGDLAGGDGGLDLQRVALACVGQAGDAGFVLITQRQVQRQVDITAQAQLVQRFLGGAFGGGIGCCGGWRGWLARHGTILPHPSSTSCAPSRSAISISPCPLS